MAETKKPAAKPIIDIAHPGKSAPSATSKPVIVTNRAILKDPMMADQGNQEPDLPDKEAAPTLAPSRSGRPNLKPTAVASEDTSATEPSSDPTPEPAKLSPAEDAATADDDEATAAGQTEQQLAAEDEAHAKHEAEIQKLIDAKQYFLPINAVEKRRSKRVVLLGVIVSLLLALAWADIALDAGLIQINGVKPATHFFSN